MGAHKMYKKILIFLLFSLVWVLPVTSHMAYAADTTSPEQVVAEFQKFPHNEMFCLDKSWNAGAKMSVIERNLKTYLSKDLYKLFLWSECVEPEVPPHYGGLYNALYFDIRFSIPLSDLRLEKKYLAKDIRVNIIKQNGVDKAVVGVYYNYDGTKMFTRYTLIQEEGQWKIDDIAPQANYVKGSEVESYEHSDSIKTEMQENYNAAMARYKEEQAKKGVVPQQ